jgi:hypothetical protein
MLKIQHQYSRFKIQYQNSKASATRIMRSITSRQTYGRTICCDNNKCQVAIATNTHR